MNKNLEELIKKNKGILRQFTALNNEVKKLKDKIKKLKQKDSYCLTEEEIKDFKIGGTDPD